MAADEKKSDSDDDAKLTRRQQLARNLSRGPVRTEESAAWLGFIRGARASRS